MGGVEPRCRASGCGEVDAVEAAAEGGGLVGERFRRVGRQRAGEEVGEVSEAEGRVHLVLEGEASVSDVLGRVIAAGAQVIAVVPSRETLEDIFVRDALAQEATDEGGSTETKPVETKKKKRAKKKAAEDERDDAVPEEESEKKSTKKKKKKRAKKRAKKRDDDEASAASRAEDV